MQTQSTPTPVAVGDEVLTTRGVESVAFVKFDQIGTGSMIVFCGSPQNVAPASVDVPVLSWSKDHTTEHAGLVLSAAKSWHGWQLVAKLDGVELVRVTGKTLAAVKGHGPNVAAVAAWHAAGNSWALPTVEEDPEEIKRRESLAAWAVSRAESVELQQQRGAVSEFVASEEHSADAVARSVRAALKASDMLDKDCNDHGKATVKNTRDSGNYCGSVEIDRVPFHDVADVVRAGVSAEMLAARRVSVKVFDGDLMTDYFSYCNVRIWPKDAEILRSAVLAGSLSPMLSSDSPRANEWRSVREFLPSSWVALADVLDGHENDPDTLCLAFAAFVSLLEQLPEGSRDSVAALLVALVPGWSSPWSQLFPAALALAGSEVADVVEEIADVVDVVDVVEVVEVEEVAPVASLEFPQEMRDYLDRLLHAPKREHAEALGLALLSGAELPQCSAAWADDVARKVRRHLAGVAS